MNGLLLAAGLGTRFKPFTDIIPKPAIPLMNVPIAFYNLHLLQQLGLEQLVVNTHHRPEVIKKMFLEMNSLGTPIQFSDEVGEILGTGGAIKKARPHLQGTGTFAVANADVVNGFGLTDALEFHHERRPLATMIVMKHPEAGKKYGAVWVNEKKQVVAIGRERPPTKCKPMHFVGVHLIEESIFKYIPDGPCDINTDVYLKAIKEGEEVLAYEKTGQWHDAGNLEDYLKATEQLFKLLPKIQHEPFFLSLFRRFWNNFDKRPNLWEGHGCDHLLSTGTSSKILMGDHCRIHAKAKVSGFLVLGDNVTVEKGAVLKNVVVMSNAIIKAGEMHQNTLILGPG